MKQWFPFTDYDFYAYLTSGMLLIAAIDYTFGGGVLVQRTQWTIVQIVFWTAVAYLIGQMLAGPSSAVLEHGVARGLLHPPIAILLGLQQRRWRELFLATLFAGREYAPLPDQIRDRILTGAAKTLGVARQDLSDPEAVFNVAFPAARKVPDAAARMDQFRNLYGFSRNISFVGLIAAVLLAIKLFQTPTTHTAWLLVAVLVVAVSMFGRFLKFYAAFSYEMLRTYSSSVTSA
ncbi:MAG: hypothetical protein ACLPKB_07175 [Xanthobacteraceae bacterium]